ncbi:MAG: hypothetical protein ACTSWQ_07400 [Candidatus Thorarchaeota archaeon]
MRNNAATRKQKYDRSRYCLSCGHVLRSDKEQRRKRCKKCHKLDKKRWRSRERLPWKERKG